MQLIEKVVRTEPSQRNFKEPSYLISMRQLTVTKVSRMRTVARREGIHNKNKGVITIITIIRLSKIIGKVPNPKIKRVPYSNHSNNSNSLEIRFKPIQILISSCNKLHLAFSLYGVHKIKVSSNNNKTNKHSQHSCQYRKSFNYKQSKNKKYRIDLVQVLYNNSNTSCSSSSSISKILIKIKILQIICI